MSKTKSWEEEFDKRYTYAFTETDFLKDYQTRQYLVKRIKAFITQLVEETYKKGVADAKKGIQNDPRTSDKIRKISSR